MNRKILLLLALLLATILFACGCVSPDQGFQPEETEEFLETYEIEPGTPVIVTNFNGKVEMRTHEIQEVEVRAVKSTQRGREELDKVAIEVTSGDILRIETKARSLNPQVTTSYEILLPVSVAVQEVKTTNGPIFLIGTSGDTLLSSSNGDVYLDSVNGYVTVRTSNGDIEIVHTTGIAGLRTTNGGISGSIGDLKAEGAEITTSNGGIELMLEQDITADLTLITSNGPVTLTFPEGFNAHIDASTTNGEVKVNGLDLTVQDSGRSWLRGTAGSGGNMLQITTTNANIRMSG